MALLAASARSIKVLIAGLSSLTSVASSLTTRSVSSDSSISIVL